MQANEASDETKEQLLIWLQSPAATSKGAREDLAWLNNSKDWSAVSIDPEKRPQPQAERKSSRENRSTPKPKAANVGDGGGLLALFGCASKRKQSGFERPCLNFFDAFAH